jgi:hypothetical protein
MLTAICRLFGLVQPCAPECAAAALGTLLHTRLAEQCDRKFLLGSERWLKQLRADHEARLACREERW